MTRSTGLAGGFVMRAPGLDEARPIAGLINACLRAERSPAVVSPAWLRTLWQTPGFDLESDAWVVTAGEGRPVGYAHLWDYPPHVALFLRLHVHPDFNGLGIDAVLLRAAEERARRAVPRAPAGARVVLATRVNGHNQTTWDLFRWAGYAQVRRLWDMGLSLEQPPPEPQWPAGFGVRTCVPGQDERAVYQALREAQQDYWSMVSPPFAQWVHWETRVGTFDPSLWFLAVREETIVGVALCTPAWGKDPRRAGIEYFGVRPAWRGQGVGEALLRHALLELHRRGVAGVGTEVDAQDKTGVKQTCEEVGMRVLAWYDLFEKELRPGGAGA